MAYQTISTFLHDSDADMCALEWAMALCRRMNAHLHIVAAGVDMTNPGGYYAGVQAFAVQHNLELAREKADALESAIETRMGREVISWDLETVTLMASGIEHFLADQMRYCDLIVLPRPYAKGYGAIDITALESCLFATDIPVLVVSPELSVELPFRRILVAWNDTSEALKAIRSAIPLLVTADTVELTMIGPDVRRSERSDPGGRLAQFLARHGAKVTVSVLPGQTGSVAESLSRHAIETGCEMFVMGAYGHSRLQEAILGGATRDMLESENLPILMAH